MALQSRLHLPAERVAARLRLLHARRAGRAGLVLLRGRRGVGLALPCAVPSPSGAAVHRAVDLSQEVPSTGQRRRR